MPQNLAGGICLGQHSVCILRAAVLDGDCSPTNGTSSGVTTLGIITMTAAPDIEEGQLFEPKTGCGDIGFTVEGSDRTKRINLSGDLLFHDYEMMKILFGGHLVIGAVGTTFAGKVIGWSELNFTESAPPAVYLEVIVKNVGQGVGDCSVGAVEIPYATGHIFGKARLILGDRTFENDVANVSFTGKSVGNPALFNGPWNDYPGLQDTAAGSPYIPNAPRLQVNYSLAAYNVIRATAGCGFQDLPVAS